MWRTRSEDGGEEEEEEEIRRGGVAEVLAEAHVVELPDVILGVEEEEPLLPGLGL